MGIQAQGQQHCLTVRVPYFPPSANHIYVNGRGGRRFLSKEAEAFKKNVISHIQSSYLSEIGSLDREALYRVWYVLYFNEKDVLTASYGSGKKDAAKSRYKRVDSQNRLKLVTDCLATAIAIDDSQFWEEGVTKRVVTNDVKPWVDIFMTVIPIDYFIVDSGIIQKRSWGVTT